eukprot:6180485-Pleurochrysis_carterae.AAC.8
MAVGMAGDSEFVERLLGLLVVIGSASSERREALLRLIELSVTSPHLGLAVLARPRLSSKVPIVWRYVTSDLQRSALDERRVVAAVRTEDGFGLRPHRLGVAAGDGWNTVVSWIRLWHGLALTAAKASLLASADAKATCCSEIQASYRLAVVHQHPLRVVDDDVDANGATVDQPLDLSSADAARVAVAQHEP